MKFDEDKLTGLDAVAVAQYAQAVWAADADARAEFREHRVFESYCLAHSRGLIRRLAQ